MKVLARLVSPEAASLWFIEGHHYSLDLGCERCSLMGDLQVIEGLPSEGVVGFSDPFCSPGHELSRFVQCPPACHDALLWVQSSKGN